MESFIAALRWIGYGFALIGFCGTVWKSISIWFSLQAFTWKDFDKYSQSVIRAITKAGYVPDVIVSIGRGGAIFGSVISGNLHGAGLLREGRDRNLPILGCDRIYEWREGQRIEVPNKMIDLSPLRGKKVLLVASDVMTGGTMKLFLKQIWRVDPACVKTACLVKGITATFNPDYFGKEIAGDFRMPWMYKGYGYVRDSRRPRQSAKRG